MKVKDLIKILRKFDPELPLITYSEEYGDQCVQKSCIKTQKVYRMGECLMLDFDGVDVPMPPYKPTPRKPGDLVFGFDEETGVITQKISLPKEGDRFTYGDKTGIVISTRQENPPDDFTKTHIEVRIKP